MRKILPICALAIAACAQGGTTNLSGYVVVEDEPGSSPTCSAATAAGELCVEGDMEVVTNLEVDGTSTLTGAITLTGAVTAASTLAVTGISTLTGGVDMAVPVAALDVIRFCGNGPNATTATYIGPVLLDDTEADLAFGGAGCDALDSTTEATADAPWHASFAFKPVAMVCTSTCGTDDTMTLQLRDDTASVAGMTCDITLAGAAAQCSVRDSTPATVAANSAIAVSAVNDTDDDCSSGDVECLLYVTF